MGVVVRRSDGGLVRGVKVVVGAWVAQKACDDGMVRRPNGQRGQARVSYARGCATARSARASLV